MDYSGNTATSPVLDDRWKNAFDAVNKALGPSGATADQQTALDFTKGQMSPGSPVNTQVGATNTALGLTNSGLGNAAQYFGNQSTRDSYTLGSLAAKATAGVPGYESYAAPTPVASQAVSAQAIDPRSGAAFIANYQDPYTDSVVNSTLNNYDKNVANQYNALRASRGAGSAFGDRAALQDDQFLSNAADSRAQLEAGLRSGGFSTAANLAQNDANRGLTASTANAANALSASTTNAANAMRAQEFNNTLANQRQQFDVNAAYQGDQLRDQSVVNQANILKQQAGLSQQQLDNIVTGNGINTSAATALFQSGQINQSQLLAVLQAAQAANGQTNSASGQQRTVGNQNSSGTEAKAGFG